MMPLSTFKKAFDFKTSTIATSFVEYIGTFNYLEGIWKDFIEKQERLPSTSQLQTIEGYQWKVASFRQSIYYIEDDDLQNELLGELFLRESEGRVVTGLELFKEVDRLEWYHEY